MSFLDPTIIPPWASGLYNITAPPNYPSVVKKEMTLRRYEISWEVPFGTRKLWVKSMKTAATIRKYLREGDAVFNLQVKRLDERAFIPSSTEHKHWVNDIEHEHHWDICDINPQNFMYLA